MLKKIIVLFFLQMYLHVCMYVCMYVCITLSVEAVEYADFTCADE